MPSVSPALCDLVTKLLTKDPTKRICINDIKKHPSFLNKIPNGYIQPSPLPSGSFNDPIDISQVSNEIIDILRKIGYNKEEELLNDLTSSYTNMTKVFYFMLTSRISLDQLQWDLSVGKNQSILYSEEENLIFNLNSGFSSNDNLYKFAGNSFIQNEAYSFAYPPDWAFVGSEKTIYDETHSIFTNDLSTFQIFTSIQSMLNLFQIQWFHPDVNTIICRKEENHFYATIQYIIEKPPKITIFRCDGSLDYFSLLVKGIGDQIEKLLLEFHC